MPYKFLTTADVFYDLFSFTKTQILHKQEVDTALILKKKKKSGEKC